MSKLTSLFKELNKVASLYTQDLVLSNQYEKAKEYLDLIASIKESINVYVNENSNKTEKREFLGKYLEQDDYSRISLNNIYSFLFDTSTKESKSWISKKCQGNRIHEPIMSYFIHLFSTRNPEMIFFDVGAYLGFFSLLALSHSMGKMKIKTFEMNPRSFKLLEKNVLINKHLDLENIEIIHAALSNIDEKDRLTKYRHFAIDPEGDQYSEDKIEFLTLDTYCSQSNIVPNLIKLDVEGHEGKIIQGATSVLSEHQPVIFLELHSNKMLQRNGTSRTEVIEQLMELGYKCFYAGKHRNVITGDLDFKDLEEINSLDEKAIDKINNQSDDLYIFSGE